MSEQKNDHPFVPPGPEDVRGPCPMLNLLANHGHLPHNGKGITRDQLANAFVNVVGCSRLFGNTFASKGFAKFVRSKEPDATLSLDMLNRPLEIGGIEHWASLSREDAPRPYVPGTQAGPPNKERIEECLAHIGKTKDDDEITMNDMAKIRNYLEKKKNCPEKDKLVAAVEAVLIHGVGHGKKGLTAKWYRSILGDERFPDDWTRSDYLLGFGVTNIISGLVALGYDKKQAENNPYTAADYTEQFDENGKPIAPAAEPTAADAPDSAQSK